MPKDQSKPWSKPARAGPSSDRLNDGESSVSTTGAGGFKKPKSLAQRDPAGLPGVSKIKASLRQTTRLLAKENLEPGLRLQTERRLASLQADLERAERRGLEKKNGARYHRVKFFEKQKLDRLIKRFVKNSETEELKKARIMYSYIIHFPNTEKYIALFPGATADDDATDASGQTTVRLPPWLNKPSNIDDPSFSARRLQILKRIEAAMESGELPATPENAPSGTGRDLAIDFFNQKDSDQDPEHTGEDTEGPTVEKGPQEKSVKIGKRKGVEPEETGAVAGEKSDKKMRKEKKQKKRNSISEEAEASATETTAVAQEPSGKKSKKDKKAKKAEKAVAPPAVVEEADDFFESD